MLTMFTTVLPELQTLRPGFIWDYKLMTFRETSGRHNIQKVHMQGQLNYFDGRYMKEVKRGKSTSISFAPPKDSVKFKVIIRRSHWRQAQEFIEKSVYQQRTTWDRDPDLESGGSGPSVSSIVLTFYFFPNCRMLLETKNPTESSEIYYPRRKFKENSHLRVLSESITPADSPCFTISGFYILLQRQGLGENDKNSSIASELCGSAPASPVRQQN